MEEKNLIDKGITLIALVITIIVLLILAGVTISLIWQGGIIDKSEQAVDIYSQKEQEEQEILDDVQTKFEALMEKEKDEWDGTIADCFENSSEENAGTKENPYTIKTAEQLAYFASQVNGGNDYTGKYIKLRANIELNPGKWTKDGDGNIAFSNDAEQWTPIGTSTEPFKGIFNGNMHTISGVYINDSDLGYRGLFGYLEYGNIKNVIISGSIVGKNSVGGIVGKNENGNVMNCHNNANILGDNVVGGIVGFNNGIITNCISEINGKITATGGYGAGGIAGRNEKNIENCINNADITGLNQVGGIVGNCDSAPNVLVSKCYNTGKIYGTDAVGGIVGGAWNDMNTTKVTIELCYNKGEVESANGRVGGVTGVNRGIIRNCYNIGNIKGVSGAGGISGTIDNTNTTSNPVGKIINCYSTGNITCTTANTYGGITGRIVNNTCEITNSYYLTGTTDVGYNGNCLTCEVESKDREYMITSNFVNDLGNSNWKLVNGKNSGYPVLSWE